MDNESENFLETLRNVQKNMPSINLPSMGLIDSNNKIVINSNDYLNNESNNSDNKEVVGNEENK